MQTQPKKKKFSLVEFISAKGQGNIIVKGITPSQQLLSCICGGTDSRRMTCFRCGSETHVCLEQQPNRGQNFQCACCLNLKMDPLYQVRRVMVQSYFTVNNIFDTTNEIIFTFSLTAEDLAYPVEVRGLKQRQVVLGWPMTGCFFINKNSEPFHELKPLMTYSNRKNRREEFIIIPKELLKAGKNQLKFKIYCLDKERFTSSYQYQEKGTYFFAVNSINKLQTEELVAETFKKRRTEKQQSLAILRAISSEVEVTKNKVTLICPYTKERIKVPIRGKYCRHFTCVCLQTVIAYHSGLRLWTCPICDDLLNEPQVDILLYSILRDNNRDGEEVIISQDGSYEWVKGPQNAIELDDSDSAEPFKHPESSAPEELTPLQLEIEPADIIPIPEARHEVKERTLKEALEVIKTKIKEKISSAPAERAQEQVSKEKGASKELIKKKVKELPIKSKPPLPEIKTLECTETHQKGYFFKNFCPKAEAAKGKSDLTKSHWEFIKYNGELKNLFVELK